MKTTQYVRQEKAIASADSGGIRQRWLWGLRLLRDADAFAPGSSQLKPGRADELIKAAKAAGMKLSATEVRLRLQYARAYNTDAEIQRASVEFKTWSALITADFPAYAVPEGEPPADHRNDAERARDAARQLAAMADDAQGTLFPLDQYEPIVTPLKDLHDYADGQDEITGRFVERGRKRRDYLDQLDAAAGYDLSMTWAEAHKRLGEPTYPPNWTPHAR